MTPGAWLACTAGLAGYVFVLRRRLSRIERWTFKACGHDFTAERRCLGGSPFMRFVMDGKPRFASTFDTGQWISRIMTARFTIPVETAAGHSFVAIRTSVDWPRARAVCEVAIEPGPYRAVPSE